MCILFSSCATIKHAQGEAVLNVFIGLESACVSSHKDKDNVVVVNKIETKGRPCPPASWPVRPRSSCLLLYDQKKGQKSNISKGKRATTLQKE